MAARIGASQPTSGTHCFRRTLACLVFLAASIESSPPGGMLEDCQVSITGEKLCPQQHRLSSENAVPTSSLVSNAVADSSVSYEGLECAFTIDGERICIHPTMRVAANTRAASYRVSTVHAAGRQIRIGFRHSDDVTFLANETCKLVAQVGSGCSAEDKAQVIAMLEEKDKHFRSLSLGRQIMERIRTAWYFMRMENDPHEAKLHLVQALASFPKSSFILRELSSLSLWPNTVESPQARVPGGGGEWHFRQDPPLDQHRRDLDQFAMLSSVRFQALPYIALAEQEKELIEAGALPSEFIVDAETDEPLSQYPFVQLHRLNHDVQLLEYLQLHGYLSAEIANPAVVAYRQVIAEIPSIASPRELIKLSERLWSLLYPFYHRRLYIHPNSGIATGALSRNRHAQLLHGFSAVPNSAIGGELSAGGVLIIDDLLSPEALAGLRDFVELSTIFIQDRNSYLGASRNTGLASPLLAQIAEELQKAFPEFLCDLPLSNLWAFKYDDELQIGIGTHADMAAVNINIWITPDEYNLNSETGGLVVYDARVDQSSDASFEDYNRGADESLRNRMLEETGYSNVTVPYRQNRAVIFDSARLHKTQDFRFKAGVRSRRINLTLLYGARGGYCKLKRRLEPRFQ